jgi:ATP-dependent DNA ligase
MPVLSFIEPFLPSPADRLPDGPDWVHEIKHDGYRLMARRDPIGIRLLSRNGYRLVAALSADRRGGEQAQGSLMRD